MTTISFVWSDLHEIWYMPNLKLTEHKNQMFYYKTEKYEELE